LSNAEDGMSSTFFRMALNKVARVHHLQQMKVRLKDHWTNFLFR
jgi:hypothetical protein